MNDTLKTEEFGKKKNYKGIIAIILIILVILAIIFGIYFYITNSKKNANKKPEVEVTTLNSELQDIYGFAISNNYIVALKSDGTTFNIYNLLQGTGNFGDFTAYSYNDNKLYLLFSDNNLYTISLDSGNGIYELTKNFSFDNLTCASNNIGKTSDLAFSKNNIYFNTSSCGVSRLNYDPKTKKTALSILKTFNNVGTDIEYSIADKSLYVKADNNIYKFDNTTGEITPIATNIITTNNLTLKSNILIYDNNVNNIKTYYGYNIKTKETVQIVTNALELYLYDNSFIYRTNDTIYMLKGAKTTTIYKVHYNNLSDMQLINKNTLQIIDQDLNDETKKRIINIDLSSKEYKTTINPKFFTNIVEYTK